MSETLKRSELDVSTLYIRQRELADLAVRLNIRTLQTDFDKTEDDMKALQSVGQVIGEILKQLDDERCESSEEVLCNAKK